MDVKKILAAVTNTRTLIALTSLVVLLFSTWGIILPEEKIMTTVEIICGIGVILGILNHTGMDTTKWNK